MYDDVGEVFLYHHVKSFTIDLGKCLPLLSAGNVVSDVLSQSLINFQLPSACQSI